MRNGIIFLEIADSFFHGLLRVSLGIAMSGCINLINGSKILGPNFMDNVGTIRLIPLFLFKKAKLSSLAKFF